MMPEAVLREIQREPSSKISSDASLAELIDNHVITVAPDTDASLSLAIELAGAPIPDDLDDGEAFAIALAVTRNAVLILDERKARRIVMARFSKLKLMFTLEYMEDAARSAGLSKDETSDVIYSALRYARMRVPRHRFKEISELVGEDRAKTCSSLGMGDLQNHTKV
jgi:predicted nucleic acid-binding protein